MYRYRTFHVTRTDLRQPLSWHNIFVPRDSFPSTPALAD
uniref:Uncharacterized protein n=1 Tax=Ralstonia pickettii (strain 12J) TaxID=402626 RepID=B2UDP9_RALPJ